VFDTSLALWGVGRAFQSTYCDSLDCAAAIRRGSKYLIDTQLPAGGWPETTRPSGGQSYAQHIATTAWALQTLLILDELQNDSN
jgi:hypothetical protein